MSNHNIQLSIKHTTGLEELLKKTFKQHTKCAACMIGKSTLEIYTGLKEGQINHSIIYTDPFFFISDIYRRIQSFSNIRRL